jgi:hypothetical protein
MRGAKVCGHFFGVVEVGDGGGEMRLAGQKDAFRRRCQIGAVLFGQFGDGESVPAEGVGPIFPK